MSIAVLYQAERIKWTRFIHELEKSCGVITYEMRRIFSRTMSDGLLNDFDKSHAMDNLAWCREYRIKWGL